MAKRRYDKEFKLNAINLHKGGKSITEVCKDLGIPTGTFFGWLKNHDVDKDNSFRGSGVPKASNEEIVKLKKELEDAKLERDILKKAVAIFSKQK